MENIKKVKILIILKIIFRILGICFFIKEIISRKSLKINKKIILEINLKNKKYPNKK